MIEPDVVLTDDERACWLRCERDLRRWWRRPSGADWLRGLAAAGATLAHWSYVDPSLGR